MNAMRRKLVALVIATMSCQMVGLVATQLVFWNARAMASGDHNQVVCTCTHGQNGECPMHKKRPVESNGASRFCSTTDSSVGFVLTALIGAPGIVLEQHRLTDPLCASDWVLNTAGPAVLLDTPPALPPPRL